MHVIETQGLTKYYGKSRGIIDVDLQISEGEIFGFIGPNGSGKSTTIRTLLNLIIPTKGSARIFGLDIGKKAKEIRKQIGFMPSEVNYYDKMDVLELLRYSAKFYGVDCEDRIKKFAEIFNVQLDRKIYDLSSGNKKKVSILQSLIHQPKLLIMDEPTSGLDPLMKAKFFEVLREENEQGATIFFSSHVLNEVQKLCKRVAIIKEGKIVNVEDIETLRHKQLKRIRVDFNEHIDTKEFELVGVKEIEMHGDVLTFIFSGSINELLNHLVNKKIDNLEIEEPTLEEIFIHYYEEE